MTTIGGNLLVLLVALLLPMLSSTTHLALMSPERKAAPTAVVALHYFAHTLIILVVVSLAGRLHPGTLLPIRIYCIVLACGILASGWRAVQGGRDNLTRALRATLREFIPASVITAICMLPQLLVVRAAK